MRGNHSQTTLVFNKRGDVRLDSLSRFHLNSQWKRPVTSHDEVIPSFTLKRLKAKYTQNVLQNVRGKYSSEHGEEAGKFKSKHTEIVRNKNAPFPHQY